MQLRQADLFVGLSPNTLKAIMAAGTRHAFAAGEFVYRRDDPADFLYILMEGDIRLRMRDEGVRDYWPFGRVMPCWLPGHF